MSFGPVGDEDVQRLGRADAVQDPQAGFLVPAPQDFGRQRLAGGDAVPDEGQVRLLAREMLQVGGIERRHAEIERRAVARDQRKARGRAGALAVEHRGGADPERKGHVVAEPIGEEQLGLGIEDVVLANAERLDAVALAADRHVAMAVHRAFRRAGGAGRIEPEAVVVGGGRHGGKARLALLEQFGQRARGTFGAQHAARLLLGGGERALDLAGKFRRVDQRGGAGVIDHEGVARRAQQRVERHRHDAGLDRAPEQIEEGRAVLHHHQQALAALEAELHQRVGAAVDIGGELGVADRAVGGVDRDLGAAALAEMAVDERRGDVVIGREAQARRRGFGIPGSGRHRFVLSFSSCYLCPRAGRSVYTNA